MSRLFAEIPYYGSLHYHHTYLFYDEPLVFSCINETFQLFFVLAIPKSDDNEMEWLLAPISQGKLLRLEKNSAEIREVFTNPESFVWRMILRNEEYSMHRINVADLTDDLLPERGEFLDYNDNQELMPSENVPSEQARREMRDILEISLERDDTHISEIPCSALGDLLNSVQQLMYAIGYKEGGLRGQIPKKVKDDCKLCVSGMFAASVGVRLKSDEFCDIQFETSLTSALQDFNRLFEVASDKETLRAFLAKQNPRVAIRYRALIRTLLQNKVGIGINDASPNNLTFSRHFSTEELAKNLEYVNSEIDEMVETETMIGRLVGINVERDTFEFITGDEENIKGILSEDLRGKTFSVPKMVEASFEISVGADSLTREEKLVYKLMSIKDFIAES